MTSSALQQAARQELARRVLVDRLTTQQEELQSLADDLNSVTAKNIELSRQKTSAQSRVKELEKSIHAAEQDVEAKRSELEALTEELSVAQRNLESVLESERHTRNQ